MGDPFYLAVQDITVHSIFYAEHTDLIPRPHFLLHPLRFKPAEYFCLLINVENASVSLIFWDSSFLSTWDVRLNANKDSLLKEILLWMLTIIANTLQENWFSKQAVSNLRQSP